MAQSSRGYNLDEEDDRADALPQDAQDRASQSLLSPNFQKPAPEPEPAPIQAPVPREAFGTPLAGALGAFEADLAPEPPETQQEALPANPDALRTPSQPRALAGADSPEIGQAMQRLGQGPAPMKPARPGMQREWAHEAERRQRESERQQSGIHAYLASKGLDTEVLPDGSRGIALNSDGSPRWKATRSEPFLDPATGRHLVRERDDRGAIKDVDLFSTKGIVHTNPETGARYYMGPGNQPIDLNSPDQSVIRSNAVKKIRSDLYANEQVASHEIQRIKDSMVDAKATVTAMQQMAAGGAEFGGKAKSVKALENIIANLTPLVQAGTADETQVQDLQDAQDKLERHHQDFPEHQLAADALAGANAQIAKINEARLKDRDRRLHLLMDPRTTSEVSTTMAPVKGDAAPGQVETAEVDHETAATAAKGRTTQSLALPKVLQRMKASGIATVGIGDHARSIDDAIQEAENPPQRAERVPEPEAAPPVGGWASNFFGSMINRLYMSGAAVNEGIQRMVGADELAAQSAERRRWYRENETREFSPDNPMQPGGAKVKTAANQSLAFAAFSDDMGIDPARQQDFSTGVAHVLPVVAQTLLAPETLTPTLLAQGAAEGAAEAGDKGESRLEGAAKGAGKAYVTLKAFGAAGKLAGKLTPAIESPLKRFVAAGLISSGLNAAADVTINSLFGGNAVPQNAAEWAERGLFALGFGAHAGFEQGKLPGRIKTALEKSNSPADQIARANLQTAILDQARPIAERNGDQETLARIDADRAAAQDFLAKQNPKLVAKVEARMQKVAASGDTSTEQPALGNTPKTSENQPTADQQDEASSEPAPTSPAGQAKAFSDTLRAKDDLAPRIAEAQGNGEFSARLNDEQNAHAAELSAAAKTATEEVPASLRKRIADIILSANEAHLAGDVDAPFAAAHVGRELRETYTTPEQRDALNETTARMGEHGPVGEFIADQHVGMLAAKDLLAIATGRAYGPEAMAGGDDYVPSERGEALARLGLLEPGEDGAPYVTHDALPLLPKGLTARLLQAHDNFRVKSLHGDQLHGAAAMVRNGQTQLENALHGRATKAREQAAPKPYHVRVEFTDQQGQPREKVIRPKGARSDDQALTEAMLVAQKRSMKVTHAEVTTPEKEAARKAQKPEPSSPEKSQGSSDKADTGKKDQTSTGKESGNRSLPDNSPEQSRSSSLEPSDPLSGRKNVFTKADPKTLAPEERGAIRTVMQFLRANRSELKAIGIDPVPALGRNSRDSSGLAVTSGGKLLLDGKQLREHFDALGGQKKALEWVKAAVIEEEGLHRHQFMAAEKAGIDFNEHYAAIREEAPADMVEHARRTYEEFDQLSPHEQGAEMERMVLQQRWHGSLTERMFKSIERILAYLRGLKIESPLLKESIARVEAVRDEALRRAGTAQRRVVEERRAQRAAVPNEAVPAREPSLGTLEIRVAPQGLVANEGPYPEPATPAAEAQDLRASKAPGEPMRPTPPDESKLEGRELHDAGRKWMDEMEVYEKELAGWTRRQPLNKPLVFERDNGQKRAVTPNQGNDVQGRKWRVTTLDADGEPIGHTVHETREDAVMAAKGSGRLAESQQGTSLAASKAPRDKDSEPVEVGRAILDIETPVISDLADVKGFPDAEAVVVADKDGMHWYDLTGEKPERMASAKAAGDQAAIDALTDAAIPKVRNLDEIDREDYPDADKALVIRPNTGRMELVDIASEEPIASGRLMPQEADSLGASKAKSAKQKEAERLAKLRETRAGFAAETGGAKDAVGEAAKIALEPPGSVLANLSFGRETLVDKKENVTSRESVRGRKWNFDLYHYKMADGRHRMVLAAGDPTNMVDAAAIVRITPNGPVIETLHGGVAGFDGLGGVVAREVARTFGKPVMEDGAPLSKVVEKHAAPEPHVLTKPDGRSVINAYHHLARTTGFPSVSIAELADQSGIPLDRLKAQLMVSQRKGSVVLSTGDWSLSSDKVKSGVIEDKGQKMLQVRFLNDAGGMAAAKARAKETMQAKVEATRAKERERAQAAKQELREKDAAKMAALRDKMTAMVSKVTAYKETLRKAEKAGAAGVKRGVAETRAELEQADRWFSADMNRVKDDMVDFVRSALPPEERGHFISQIASVLTDRPGILRGNHADATYPFRAAFKLMGKIQAKGEEVGRKGLMEEILAIRKRALASPSVAVDYKARLNRALGSFSFTRISSEKRAELESRRAFVEQQRLAGNPLHIPPAEMQEMLRLDKKHVLDLSTPALQALHAEVEALEDLGRQKWSGLQGARERLVAGDMAQLNALKDGQHTVFDERSPIKAQPPASPDDPGGLKLSQKLHNVYTGALNNALLLNRAVDPMNVLFDIADGGRGTYDGFNMQIKGRVDLAHDRTSSDEHAAMAPLRDVIAKHKLKEGNFLRIGALLTSMQEGGAERINVTPARLAEIESSLSPGEKEFIAEWQKFSDREGPTVAEIMRKQFNQEVKIVPGYFPLSRDQHAYAQEQKGHPIDAETGSPIKTDEFGTWRIVQSDFNPAATALAEKGFAIERQQGAKTPVKINALEVIEQHVRNLMFLKNAQADLIRAKKVFGSAEYAKKFGAETRDLAMKWLDVVARQGGVDSAARNKTIDFLRRNTSRAIMAFRLGSQLQNLAALPFAFHHAGGVDNFLRGFHVGRSEEGQQFVGKHLASIMDRRTSEAAQQEIINSRVTEAGFAVARWLDRNVAQATAVGSYLGQMAKKGYSTEQALKAPDTRNGAPPTKFEQDSAEALREARVRMQRAVSSAHHINAPLAISRGVGFGGNVSMAGSAFQFKGDSLNRLSNFTHDLWRAGIIKNRDPKAAIFITTALLASAGISVALRHNVRHLTNAITGFQPKKDEDSLEKQFLLEVLRSHPVMETGLNMAMNNTSGIGAIDVPVKGFHDLYMAPQAKEGTDMAKRLVRGVSSLVGAFTGAPGSSYAGELAAKSIGNEPPNDVQRIMREGGIKRAAEKPEGQPKRKDLVQQVRAGAKPQDVFKAGVATGMKAEQVRSAVKEGMKTPETVAFERLPLPAAIEVFKRAQNDPKITPETRRQWRAILQRKHAQASQLKAA